MSRKLKCKTPKQCRDHYLKNARRKNKLLIIGESPPKSDPHKPLKYVYCPHSDKRGKVFSGFVSSEFPNDSKDYDLSLRTMVKKRYIIEDISERPLDHLKNKKERAEHLLSIYRSRVEKLKKKYRPEKIRMYIPCNTIKELKKNNKFNEFIKKKKIKLCKFSALRDLNIK